MDWGKKLAASYGGKRGKDSRKAKEETGKERDRITSYRFADLKPEEGFQKTEEKLHRGMAAKEGGRDGFRKAAQFLLMLDEKQAAEVLSRFSPGEIEGITKEIAGLERVDRDEAGRLLEELGYDKRRSKTAEGGIEVARSILDKAFGTERGSRIIKRVLPFEGRRPFDFMNDLEPAQILVVLKNEPPAVISVVMSYLTPELSARLVEHLPKESRKEILLRIAHQGKLSPDVVEKMETVFRERIRQQGQVVSQEIDGKNALVDILRHMDLQAEKQIIEVLQAEDETLGREVRENLMSIDVVLRIAREDLQTLLRDFDDRELAVLLKGKSDEIRRCFWDSLSERRIESVRDEMDHAGPMRRSEVDKLTKEFLDYLMNMEEEGKLIIPRKGEEYV